MSERPRANRKAPTAGPLATRAELVRLARTLACDPDDLAFLDGVALDDLRALRGQVADHLHDRRRESIRRVGAAARLLPGPVAASLAEKGIGPVMAGLISSSLDVGRLVDVARRLPAPFLADVCPHVDERHLPTIGPRLPTKLVARVAHELARRGDHVTMAQFVAHVDDAAILAVVADLDDEHIVRTAPLVEATERVDAICAALDDDRVAALVRAAATPELVADCLGLLAAVGPDQLRRLGTVALDAGPDLIGVLVAHAAEHDLWDGLLPLVSVFDPADRARLAAVPALHDPGVLAGVTRAAVAGDRWLDLLPLAPLLPVDAQAHVAEVVGGLDDPTLGRLAAEAAAAGMAVELLTLLGSLDAGMQERVVTLAAGRRGVVGHLARGLAAEEHRWADAHPALAALAPGTLHALADPIAALDARLRARLRAAAEAHGGLAPLGPVGAALSA